MADKLKRVTMSTPEYGKKCFGRRSLPNDTRCVTPDIFADKLHKSSPFLGQKCQLMNKSVDAGQSTMPGDKVMFGTPSYPSPLDRVRAGRRDRALQMGLPLTVEESFLANQSFPKVSKSKLQTDLTLKSQLNLKNLQCNGINDVSFSPGLCKGSFATTPEASVANKSLNESWSFYNYIGGGPSGMVFPTTVRNPNKAICTIDARTSQILVANEMACELFSYEQDDLIGRCLQDLIQLKPRDQQTLVESHLELNGELVDIAGKVVDAVDSNGLVLPVSLWVKKLEGQSQPRCLCVMEPVERTVATVRFDTKGCILNCDKSMATVYGYHKPEDIQGLHMRDLIPAFKCPADRRQLGKDVSKQRATGRTRDGSMFPLSIVVKLADEDKDRRNIPPDNRSVKEVTEFTGIVWVFANISGMITFFPNGTIHSINDNFARMLFGYDKEEIIGKDISCLIPDFYDILDLDDGIPLPPLEDDDDASFVLVDLKSDILQDELDTPVKTNGERCDLLNGLTSGQPGITSTPKNPIEIKEKNRSIKKVLTPIEVNKSCQENGGKMTDVDQVLNDMEHLQINGATEEQGNNLRKNDLYLEAHDLSHISSSTVEFLSPPARRNQPSHTDSCVSNSSVRADSSQDGVNGDVSNDMDSSGDASFNKVQNCPKRKQKDLLSELQKRLSQKHELETADTSSSSAEGSYSIFGEQMTNLLPLFVKKTADSTDEAQLDEESSYFSRDGVDSQPSMDSSGSNKSSSQPSETNVTKPQSPAGQATEAVLTNGMAQPCISAQSGTQTSYTEEPDQFPEGSFTGQCRHRDGHKLGIIFQLKQVELEDGQMMYCMYVSRDPEDPGEGGRSYANLTLASSLNSTLDKSNMSLGELLVDKACSVSKTNIVQTPIKSVTDPVLTDESDDDTEIDEDASDAGDYDKTYDTLDSIGKGAFGFVKLGRRKKDKEEVVVKFIRRGKVLKDCWMFHEVYGKIPMEVNLLLKLNHPNIVRVMDVFQNQEFVQMVMEKHGSGMDLFEFIDRNPRLDECLASFIFRQMVAGVSYLHNNNILHRDIKDENIILDEQFRIKLIDFGAATYMRHERLFGTFCGTLEYCSPEVLLGNKYRGPELEVWSMGVTLYTLVFGENPFFDVEETIECKLKPPFHVSRSLSFLITWMLHKDPVCRATINDIERNAWIKQPVDITLYKWEDVLPNSEFHGNNAADNRPDSPSDLPPMAVPGFKPYEPESDDSDLHDRLTEVLQYEENVNPLKQYV